MQVSKDSMKIVIEEQINKKPSLISIPFTSGFTFQLLSNKDCLAGK